MTMLLQKDRPWIAVFFVAGVIGLALGITEQPFLQIFVLGPNHVEVAFHVAWIAGLLLGAVAACWDEVLRTREFLEQRPLAVARVANARFAGCGVVLAAWFVGAPLCAWLWFAVFDSSFQLGHWRGLPEIWATLVVAVSACSIGLFTGALPAPWWLRLCAAALFGGAFLVIHDFARLEFGLIDPLPFVAGHLATAAVLFATARAAMRERCDADRPWPPGCTRLLAGIVTVAFVVSWSFVVAEGERAAVGRVHSAYPYPAVRGHDVVLVRRSGERGRRTLVDREHREVGTVADAELTYVRFEPPRIRSSFDLYAPLWHPYSNTYHRSVGWTQVTIGHDGACWTRAMDDTGLRPTGKGPALEPFAAGSRGEEMRDGTEQRLVVVDAATREPWRFDPGANHFVPLPLPGGDRFATLRRARGKELEPGELNEWLAASLDRSGSESFPYLRGERGNYVFDGGQLVPFRVREKAQEPEPLVVEVSRDADPLSFEASLAASPRSSALAHTFTPRTAWERVHAGIAMSCSLVRPPIAQVAAHTIGDPVSRQSWVVDPLIAKGRRTWLVLACVALAACGAWRARRRLRALDAPAQVLAFWTVATLLFGPAALLACIAFERPRAYARRASTGPFPAPRIITPSPEESIA
jgi:hypothetical protein